MESEIGDPSARPHYPHNHNKGNNMNNDMLNGGGGGEEIIVFDMK